MKIYILTVLLLIVSHITSYGSETPENVKRFLEFHRKKINANNFKAFGMASDEYNRKKYKQGLLEFLKDIEANWNQIRDGSFIIKDKDIILEIFYQKFIENIHFYYLQKKTYDKINLKTLYESCVFAPNTISYPENILDEIQTGYKNSAIAWLDTLNKYGVRKALSDTTEDGIISNLLSISRLIFNYDNLKLSEILTLSDLNSFLKVIQNLSNKNDDIEISKLLEKKATLLRNNKGYSFWNVYYKEKLSNVQINDKIIYINENYKKRHVDIIETLLLNIKFYIKKKPDYFSKQHISLTKFVSHIFANTIKDQGLTEKQNLKIKESVDSILKKITKEIEISSTDKIVDSEFNSKDYDNAILLLRILFNDRILFKKVLNDNSTFMTLYPENLRRNNYYNITWSHIIDKLIDYYKLTSNKEFKVTFSKLIIKLNTLAKNK